MSGYNDKMSVLVKDILGRIKNLKIDEQRLAALKEQVCSKLFTKMHIPYRPRFDLQAQREWRNFFLGQSYTLSDYYARYILTETQWTVEEKLKEIATVTGEDIRSYMKSFLSGVNLRMVVGGNIYKDVRIPPISPNPEPLCSQVCRKLSKSRKLLKKGCSLWSHRMT